MGERTDDAGVIVSFIHQINNAVAELVALTESRRHFITLTLADEDGEAVILASSVAVIVHNHDGTWVHVMGRLAPFRVLEGVSSILLKIEGPDS